MQLIEKFWKYEKYVFFSFVFIFLLPVIGIRYFPTLDGPAHLYNANLLNQLWFHGHSEILRFFDLNLSNQTNWISHIWFAICSFAFKTFLVEKSIIVFYIIALPYSFRYLIISLTDDSEKSTLSSYLIFPFIYSFPLCIGFYNFCVGIPILFYCIIFWIENKEMFYRKKIIQFTLLVTALYLTHLFNFLLLGIMILSIEINQMITEKKFQLLSKKYLILLLASLPGIIFSLFFIFSNIGYEPPRYFSKGKLFLDLIQLYPIITLNYEKERYFAYAVLFSLCLLGTLIIFKGHKNKEVNKPARNFTWLISASIVLCLYFILPDWMVSGGFISIRFALFFYLLVVIGLACSVKTVKQLVISVCIVLVTSLCSLAYHFQQTKKLSAEVEELLLAETRIEKGKILLPLNYSDNWLESDFSNYLGAHKFIIVLDNYEATKPHFPLKWKAGQNPYKLLGNIGEMNPCIDIEKYEKSTGNKIDYVSRWFYNDTKKDSCTLNASKQIESKFDLIFTSPNYKFQLFKRKKG